MVRQQLDAVFTAKQIPVSHQVVIFTCKRHIVAEVRLLGFRIRKLNLRVPSLDPSSVDGLWLCDLLAEGNVRREFAQCAGTIGFVLLRERSVALRMLAIMLNGQCRVDFGYSNQSFLSFFMSRKGLFQMSFVHFFLNTRILLLDVGWVSFLAEVCVDSRKDWKLLGTFHGLRKFLT